MAQVKLPWGCDDCERRYWQGLDRHRKQTHRIPSPVRRGKRHDPNPPSVPTATGWVRYGENHWVKVDEAGSPWVAWRPS